MSILQTGKRRLGEAKGCAQGVAARNEQREDASQTLGSNTGLVQVLPPKSRYEPGGSSVNKNLPLIWAKNSLHIPTPGAGGVPRPRVLGRYVQRSPSHRHLDSGIRKLVSWSPVNSRSHVTVNSWCLELLSQCPRLSVTAL